MVVSVLLVTCLVAFTAAAPYEEVTKVGFTRGRVVGGETAIPNEFPWQVSLQWNRNPETTPRGTHNCGGSIIKEGVILTAAHCVVGLPTVGRYEILAGKHALSTTEASEQKVLVRQTIVHPNYPSSPVVAPYDVALILTDKLFTLTKEVQIVPLPQPGAIPSGSVTLSGWGSTSTTSNPSMPNLLQKVTKPILPFAECDALIGSSTPLHVCNLCTGPLSGGISACSGDSGGPLVQVENGKTTLVGVVSWGYIPCGSRNSPSVYSRVSFFVDWIKENGGL